MIEAHCTCRGCDHEWDVDGPVNCAFGDGCPECDGYDVSFSDVKFIHDDDDPLWVEHGASPN